MTNFRTCVISFLPCGGCLFAAEKGIAVAAGNLGPAGKAVRYHFSVTNKADLFGAGTFHFIPLFGLDEQQLAAVGADLYHFFPVSFNNFLNHGD